jgi:hypothetical protein
VAVNDPAESAYLVSLDTDINGTKPIAPAASTARRSSWLSEFLTRGTETRYNPFDPKDDDIQIWMDSEDEAENE